MSVRRAKIGSLAEQIRGVSFAKHDASATHLPGYVPVLRAGNITDEGLSFDDLIFVPAVRVSEKQKIRRHDVVIAASSGSLDVVGKAAPVLSDYDCTFGAFCKVLRPNSNIDARYFAQFFQTREYRTRISAAAAGININNLRNEDLDVLEIPLPPLAEQGRIASILDKAEALRKQRRATLAQVDFLKQSIFVDLFGNPELNSKGWEICRLGNELKLQGGFAFKSSDYKNTGIRLVKISNVQKDTLDWATTNFVPEEYLDKYADFKLLPGDIVLALTRPIIKSLESVKIAVVKDSDVPSLLNQRVGRLRFGPDSRLLPEYIFEFCRTKRFFRTVQFFCSESLQPNMSTSQIEEVMIAVPPMDLQREFARRMAAVEKLKAAHRASLAEMDALFASLQHRAFNGQL